MEDRLVIGSVVTTRVTITGEERSEKSKSAAVLSTKPALIQSFSATAMQTTGNGETKKKNPTELIKLLSLTTMKQHPNCGLSGTRIKATWTSETIFL